MVRGSFDGNAQYCRYFPPTLYGAPVKGVYRKQRREYIEAVQGHDLVLTKELAVDQHRSAWPWAPVATPMAAINRSEAPSPFEWICSCTPLANAQSATSNTGSSVTAAYPL